MTNTPIDESNIIKDGAIKRIIDEFKDLEKQLNKNNEALKRIAKSSEIKPAVNTEEFNKLLAKIESLENGYKKLSENKKNLTAIERERLKLTKAIETAEAKKIIAVSKENKSLIELQQRTSQANKAQRDALKASERQKNAYSKLSDKTKDLKNESKRLGAELLLLESKGKKNSIEWNKLSKTYEKVTANAKKSDAQLKKLDARVGDNQRKVGLYENATRKLSRALGALGIAFGIGQLKTFASELIEINSQSKGVQFAFDRLGLVGIDAFTRIKKATRGLLSDLEIKKSINEFKNFNISLDQTDTLFEFLSVRATQTGKSVDSLRDSLVEGLSKESKLRIDNLGISTKDLNDELAITPNFVDAVANIAKRELLKAGNILDDAGSAQGRWNAQLANTKEILAKEMQPAFESAFKNGSVTLKFLADNLKIIIKLVSLTIKTFITYKAITISSAIANKVLSLSFVKLGRSIGGMKGVIAGVSGAFKNLGKTIKANAFGLIVFSLVEVYKSLNLVTSASKKLKNIQKTLIGISTDTKISLEKEKDGLNTLIKAIKNTTNGTKERKIAIDNLNKKYNVNLTNITDETKFLKSLDVEQKKILKNIENKLYLMEKEQEFNIFSEQIIMTEVEQTKLRAKIAEAWGQNAFTEFIQGFGDYENTKSILGQQFKENEKLLDDLRAKKKLAKGDLSDLLKLQAESQKISKSLDAPETPSGKKKDLSGYIKRMEDLKIQALKDDEQREIDATKIKFKRELKAITGNSEVEKNLKIQLEINLQIELSKIKDKFAKQRADKNTAQYERDYNKQIEIEKSIEEAKAKTKSDFQKRAAEETRKEIARKKRLKEEAALELKRTKKAIADSIASSVNVLTTMANSSIDSAIEGQNRLISNSQRTIDMIKQSAIAGNVQAKDSILAEEKAIEESQARIEKAQKKKQRNELISTGINSYNSKIVGGASGLQALGQTGAEMAGLIGLLNALPSFFIGADRLSRNGSPIDSKGGFLAINHPDERIITAEQNKIIGYSQKNETVANVMDFYNKGLLIPSSNVGVVAVKQDNSEILKSINEGFGKINNYNMSVTELFGQITVLIEHNKNGDTFKSKKTYR